MAKVCIPFCLWLSWRGANCPSILSLLGLTSATWGGLSVPLLPRPFQRRQRLPVRSPLLQMRFRLGDERIAGGMEIVGLARRGRAHGRFAADVIENLQS